MRWVGRRLPFDGAATELNGLPAEAASGPTTYNETVSESVTGAESLGAALTAGPTLSESVAGADVLTAAVTFNPTLSEPATAAEVVYGNQNQSRDFEASLSEYGEYAGVVVSTYPFTFACWVKPESIGTAGTIFAIATSGSADHYFRVDVSGSGNVRVRARTTAVTDAITANAMTAGQWYLVAAVFASATDRRAFLMADKATSTASRSPAGMNRTSVGRSAESAGTSYYDGLVAVPTVWNVALSDSEVAQLAAGTHPLTVQNSAVVSHWPFNPSSPGTDTVSGFNLSFTGSANVAGDSPPMNGPSAGGTTYNDSVSEGLSGADAPTAALTAAPALSEAAAAGDAVTAAAALSAARSEALTAADALAAVATCLTSLVEPAVALDASAGDTGPVVTGVTLEWAALPPDPLRWAPPPSARLYWAALPPDPLRWAARDSRLHWAGGNRLHWAARPA